MSVHREVTVPILTKYTSSFFFCKILIIFFFVIRHQSNVTIVHVWHIGSVYKSQYYHLKKTMVPTYMKFCRNQVQSEIASIERREFILVENIRQEIYAKI